MPTKRKITLEAKRRMCSGCHDEFYHQHRGMCWSFDSAEPVLKREVHVDQRPPWNQKPIQVLNCYHRPRYVYVDPSVTC